MDSHRVYNYFRKLLLEWMAKYSLKPSLIFNNNKSSLSFIHIACYQSQRTVMWSNLILIKIHNNFITWILQIRIMKPEDIIFHICYSSMSQNVNCKHDSHYPTKLDTLDTLPREWGDNSVNKLPTYSIMRTWIQIPSNYLKSEPLWYVPLVPGGAQRRTPGVF